MNFKWRNKGLWVALGALATLILNDLFGITPDQTEPYVDLALTILIAAGIVSNPADGEWFIDKNNNGIDDRQEGEK